MDKTALVATDFAIGPKLVEALDKSDLSISVALWADLAEYENRRLCYRHAGWTTQGPLAAYRLANDALDAAGSPLNPSPLC